MNESKVSEREQLTFLPEADFEALARLELDHERSLLLEADSVAFIKGDDETRFNLDRSLAVQLSRANEQLLVELRQRSSEGWQRQRLLGPYSGIDGLAPSYAGNADGRLWTVDTQTLRTLLARLRASMQLDGGENWLLPTPAPKSAFEQRLQRLLANATPAPNGLSLKQEASLLRIRQGRSQATSLLLLVATLGALTLSLVIATKGTSHTLQGVVGFGLLTFGLAVGTAYSFWFYGTRTLVALSEVELIAPTPFPSPIQVLGISAANVTWVPGSERPPMRDGTPRRSDLHLHYLDSAGKSVSSRLGLDLNPFDADWVAQVIAVWFGVEPLSTELSSERNRWPMVDEESDEQSLFSVRPSSTISITSLKGKPLKVDRRKVSKVEFLVEPTVLRVALQRDTGSWRQFYAFPESWQGRASEQGIQLEPAEMLRLYAHLSSLRPPPCHFDASRLRRGPITAGVLEGELHIRIPGHRSTWLLGAGLVGLFSGALLLAQVPLAPIVVFLGPVLAATLLAAWDAQKYWVADRKGVWSQNRLGRRLLLNDPRSASAGALGGRSDTLGRKRVMLESFGWRFVSPPLPAQQADTVVQLFADWFGFSDPAVFERSQASLSDASKLKRADADDDDFQEVESE
ncbi:MAG: hypothetical protein RBU37_15905 [Myxococcota bacterium]|nr:hypothetical protein [Myxococcota bacterium]